MSDSNRDVINLLENLKINGSVSIYDIKKENIIPIFNRLFFIKNYGSLRENKNNLIVDVGRQLLLDALIGLFTDSQYDTRDHEFFYIAIGTGTNPPASTDTNLQTISADGWKQVGDRYRVGNEAFAAYEFSANEGNGSGTLNWKEAGLRSKSNILYSRALIDYIKSNSYLTVVEWKWSWTT